jgi:hypothetical protein
LSWVWRLHLPPHNATTYYSEDDFYINCNHIIAAPDRKSWPIQVCDIQTNGTSTWLMEYSEDSCLLTTGVCLLCPSRVKHPLCRVSTIKNTTLLHRLPLPWTLNDVLWTKPKQPIYHPNTTQVFPK